MEPPVHHPDGQIRGSSSTHQQFQESAQASEKPRQTFDNAYKNLVKKMIFDGV